MKALPLLCSLVVLLSLWGCKNSDHPQAAVNVLSESPKILLLGNFLTDAECEALKAKAEPHLARSTVVNDGAPGSAIHNARTSRGMFITDELRDPLVATIEKRIEKLTNIPVEHGEAIQVVNYGTGQEYRPHFDYFDKLAAGGADCLANGGQRLVTVIMYLHTTDNGGETIFPELNIKVKPQKGSALVFYNCPPNGEVDPRTLHGGAPVASGEKWIATKWLRAETLRKP